MKLLSAARAAACSALLLLAAACMTSTPYQPLIGDPAITGGYTDTRLANDRYQVTFAGNSLTSRERVESYLLFRAAELTLRDGYDWFIIQDKEMDHLIDRETRPDPSYRPWYGGEFGDWRPYWRYRGPGSGWQDWDPYHGDPFWTDKVDVTQIERFEATAEIKLGRGPMPANQPQFVDARQVIADIGPQVQYPNREAPRAAGGG